MPGFFDYDLFPAVQQLGNDGCLSTFWLFPAVKVQRTLLKSSESFDMSLTEFTHLCAHS